MSGRNVEKLLVMEILRLDINSNKILWNRVIFVLLIIESRISIVSIGVKMIKTLVYLSVNLNKCSVFMKLREFSYS